MHCIYYLFFVFAFKRIIDNKTHIINRGTRWSRPNLARQLRFLRDETKQLIDRLRGKSGHTWATRHSEGFS